MEKRAGLRPLLVVPSILFTLIVCVSAQDSATSQIKSEIARLQQSIKEKPVTDKNFAPIADEAADALKGASAAIESGQVYFALERLSQAEDLLRGARAGADQSEVERAGMPAFQSQWGKVSLRLTALDREAHARQWKGTPLAVQALAEAAQGRAIPLLEGGLGFAVATGPKDGLLYVGQAEGEAEFAAFCAKMTFSGKKGSPFPLRSLLPELQSLQTKVNAAFQPPKSIDQHGRFIALNSELKLAKELDASKFYAGALYAFLEAARHYGMLDVPAQDAKQQEKLKEDIAAERKKLNASTADDSLAQLFLQRAEFYTAHPDGSATSEVEWKVARVILDQVLPAYFAAKQPAAPVKLASGKTVEITLVRWPYT